MKEPPFSSDQVRALTQLVGLWSPTTSFVLVGASALLCHCASLRPTHDLDFAVAVSLDGFRAGLDKLAGWQPDPRREHRWFAPGPVYVDVLPASPSLLAVGTLTWPNGNQMSLKGLEHAFTRAVSTQVVEGLWVPVAPLDVLAFLKIVSFLDRPTEREHDLQDLTTIMDSYLPYDDERRWSAEVVDSVADTAHAGSFVLGRELAQFLAAADREILAAFLSRLRDDSNNTLSKLVRRAPPAWKRQSHADSEDEILRLFYALERGLKANLPERV